MAKRRSPSTRSRRRSRPGTGRAIVWLVVIGVLAAAIWYVLRRHPLRPDWRPWPVAAAVAKPLPQEPVAPRPPAAPVAARPAAAPPPLAVKFQAPEVYPRFPATWFEAQVALAREGFSCGSIDGVGGAQTLAAWHAFQAEAGLPETNWLDPRTCTALPLAFAPTTQYILTAADLARLQPLSPTWLGKAQQTALEHETVLELLAERFRAHPNLLKKLNPECDWAHVSAGAAFMVPAADRTAPRRAAAALHIRLEAHTLQAFDADGRVIAHFPVSIARKAEKRPVGELHVTVVIADPNYTFDPEVFPESPEAQEIGRKLIVPPGPNNPVGVAWIGLDRTGYGIHGTPNPEQVGRTESHGCFRLANWDARTLLGLAWVGLPVYVDP